MNALQFDFNLGKYLFTKAAGRFVPSLHWHPHLSCLSWKSLDEPSLPNDDWVKIKVKYGGICGSDINLLFLHDSPATSPFASFPCTLGHEAVGEISEVGKNASHIKCGTRVVVNPVLSCESRGIQPRCPACLQGNENQCKHKTIGTVEPGLLIGTCHNTSGSWSPYFVAHKSQVLPLPDEVDDLNGVLVEPFSCALHAVLRHPPKIGEHVLIIGAGVIGLSVVAALKALEFECNITVLAKHSFQGEMAKHLGADQVIYLTKNNDYVLKTAQAVQAKLLKPLFGPKVVQGGASVVYECVGNKRSVDDALRFTDSGKTIVLLGLASVMKKVDWTTVWLNELTVKGCFAYSTHTFEGKKRSTLDIAIELMKRGKVDLSALITHRFPLPNYHAAFDTITKKHSNSTLKVVFEHEAPLTGGE